MDGWKEGKDGKNGRKEGMTCHPACLTFLPCKGWMDGRQEGKAGRTACKGGRKDCKEGKMEGA